VAQKAKFEAELATANEIKRLAAEAEAAAAAKVAAEEAAAQADAQESKLDAKAKKKADKLVAKMGKQEAKAAAKAAAKAEAAEEKEAALAEKKAKIEAEKERAKADAEDEEEYHYQPLSRGSAALIYMKVFLLLVLLGVIVGAGVVVHQKIYACSYALVEGDVLRQNFTSRNIDRIWIEQNKGPVTLRVAESGPIRVEVTHFGATFEVLAPPLRAAICCHP
jgi:hypothetical protein